jgi:hypothetical protein
MQEDGKLEATLGYEGRQKKKKNIKEGRRE